jgi:AAA domain, putative AbiEii toxin, Type IV TA system
MYLQLKNIGQITNADIRFGDLTVFVGPQATGKTIALEFLKLAVDLDGIQETMGRYGLDWSGELRDFFGLYFGEGMQGLWQDGRSEFRWKGSPVPLNSLLKRSPRRKLESVFYIPAQRVLALRDGWPQPFSAYSSGVPFVLREFSEDLRQLMGQFKVGGTLFPEKRWLNKEFRGLLEQNIFANFKLVLETHFMQMRLVLKSGEQSLPFMVWSAGQREFVPLLLGLYWLLPSLPFTHRSRIKWVVLEELEMGLHPRAIETVLLIVLELVVRGYRVCLSTHTAQVLEALWALRNLRANRASPQALLNMFDAPVTPSLRRLAETVMTKQIKVYYFDPTSGATRDISALDVDSEDVGEDGWGGLSEFSGRVNAAVARAVANAERVGRA